VNVTCGRVWLVPLGPATVGTTESLPGGVTAEIWVSESTANDAAGVPPKLTAVAPVKPAPVIVTVVPPSEDPIDGSICHTEGLSGVAAWQFVARPKENR
jgi:hypothetical protein